MNNSSNLIKLLISPSILNNNLNSVHNYKNNDLVNTPYNSQLQYIDNENTDNAESNENYFDNKDLYGFYTFLVNFKNNESETLNFTEYLLDKNEAQTFRYLASVFQLFTLILIFLCVIFVCKCNKIMYACRRYAEPDLHNFNDANTIYRDDKKMLIDYLCSSCRCFKKLKICFKRKRKINRKHQKRFNRKRVNIKKSSGFKKQNSVLQKRNTIIHRNRMYSNQLRYAKNSPSAEVCSALKPITQISVVSRLSSDDTNIGTSSIKILNSEKKSDIHSNSEVWIDKIPETPEYV